MINFKGGMGSVPKSLGAKDLAAQPALQDKRTQRRTGRARRDRIDFAELADEPLYQRVAALTCPSTLKARLDGLGFDTAARVAALPTVEALRVAAALDRSAETRQDTAALMREARQEALRSYRLMRHALAFKDPMNQGLRHVTSDPTPDLEQALVAAEAQSYAEPSSLQSTQSPAAYLRHLYRIATGLDKTIGLRPPEKGPYRLDARRPDLAQLVLSETHLKQEIPTITLVNEVLSEALGNSDFDRSFCPVVLPFDDQAETARISLGRIGGTTLNRVYAETRADLFPVSQTFRLVWDEAGLLGLTGNTATTSKDGSEVSLLCEGLDGDPADRVPTLGGLYDAKDPAVGSALSYLTAILDLDFSGLVQFLGLYVVEHEAGGVAAQMDYATAFLGNAKPFEVVGDQDTRVVQIDGAPLEAPDLRSLNYLARLHHATGLEFHQLNWILSVPGASAAVDEKASPNTLPRRKVTTAGLRLLAGFQVFQEIFGLDIDAYAALFGTLNPFRRSGLVVGGSDTAVGLEQTETSFLRQTFGADTAELQQALSAGKTSAKDTRLGTILKRGLGVTAVELDALIDALNPAYEMSSGLDDRSLSGIYRLRTVFRLLDWPILDGMRLLAFIGDLPEADNGSLAALVARNETSAETGLLCDALDQLIGLSQWMTSAGLTPDALLSLLPETAKTGLRASDADRTWFERFAEMIGAARVTTAILSGSDIWDGSDGGPMQISLADLLTFLSLDSGFLDSRGIFLRPATRDEILTVLDAYLAGSLSIDLSTDKNRPRLARLAAQLERAQASQVRVLEGHVASLSSGLNEAGSGPLIIWAQTTNFDLIHRLLRGAEDQSALFWLRELRRYVGAVDALGLGDVELWMIANTPTWLAPCFESATGPAPLSLAQFFHLHGFGSIQVGVASDAAWRGYLALANEGKPEAGAPPEDHENWRLACTEAMAILLGAATEDALSLVEAVVGPGAVAKDTTTIECIARHVRLSQDLSLGGPDLLALKAVARSDVSGDWTAAAAAARAGLSGFRDGAQVAVFEKAYAEVRRDALVAAYMRNIVAPDAALASVVTDTEQLYRHLLLDVNVTSAVPTSRLVEAINSLQLYIDRALNGAEPGVEFQARKPLSDQWQLDQEYRLWEANQKLKLYPQNYIEPDLRYTTSPEFEELLQTVSGKDVTEDAVETAVNSYMSGVAKCCDLTLCSLCVDRHLGDANSGDATYHFLARAQWEPGRFFYRKLEADFKTIAALTDPSQYLKALDWTFWQEVVIPKTHELFSDVTVCFFGNRYYFFWLEIEERRKQVADGGEEVSWFIHPRYMRCDNNALTGPMHTPTLFSKATGDEEPTGIDGAYEWTGTRPSLVTTYNPDTLTGRFSFGHTQPLETESELQNVMYVTFGLATNGTDRGTPDAAIQLRLASEWSDAILLAEPDLDMSIEKAAPARYDGIFPRPRSEDSCAAEEDVISLPEEASFVTIYETPDGKPAIQSGVGISSAWEPSDEAPQKVEAQFRPSIYDTEGLGTFTVTVHLGDRSYFLFTNADTEGSQQGDMLVGVSEVEPLRRRMEIELTYTGPDGEEDSYPATVAAEDTPVYVDNSLAMQISEELTETSTHLRNDTFSGSISIPRHWTVDADKTTRISVKARVTVYFPKVMVVRQVPGQLRRQVVLSPRDGFEESSLEFTELEFSLGIGEIKQSSGWALEGAHGTRNFVHLFGSETDRIEKSFLLLNSSSAIARLAETMPRPGGCETLFEWENQLWPEDLGQFVPGFEETLAKIYSEDTTKLDPARKPAAQFQFEAAYGGYGWEIFYHIPSAIAAGYAGAERYDDALSWLAKIFDPQASPPWRVVPLATASIPQNGLAFDTGEVFVDPDRIAEDYPFYYQQATIRQYLEVMLAAGDAAYAEQTQEALQKAKSIYVSAKQFFRDELSETLEVLKNKHWNDPPTLAEASANGYPGFLPPYNQELRDLYNVIEARVESLRQWRDLDGEPLSVPLLDAPIDPRELQRAGKAAQTLRSAEYAEDDEPEARLDFMTVARSAKQYIANLKTTSSRLQASLEKRDSAAMAALLRHQAVEQTGRSGALQELVIETAQKEVEIKEANLVGANAVLSNHVSKVLVEYGLAFAVLQIKTAVFVGRLVVQSFMRGTFQISGLIKSNIPVVFGFSNGGANMPMADMVSIASAIGQAVDESRLDRYQEAAVENIKKLVDLTTKTIELSAKVASAKAEVAKAKASLAQENQVKLNLEQDLRAAEKVARLGKQAFGTSETYSELVTELEALMQEEWTVTHDFCKLLVQLYNDEAKEANGASFLRTSSLGTGLQRLNAPYHLALDVERLEAAYIRSIIQGDGERSSVQFELRELEDLGGQASVVDALATQGQAYFELTEDMFDAFYPGQYDRRIQNVRIAFSGLARAGLNPHARLLQLANTRCMTRERELARGARLRKNQHALQSVMIGKPELDTETLHCAEGQLRRFQNTGVHSRWHLVLPSVVELLQPQAANARNKAWRERARRNFETIKPHLGDIEFEVSFSGRWS